MGQLVQPEVFLVGYTQLNYPEIRRYLVKTGQTDFFDDLDEAIGQGISPGEILCSMFAKMCYKSLVVGKNANVSKTRSVKANLENCFNQGHGSVFEHFQLNFIITNCSRIFTHELVRHRVGTAFSQTSGRYCRLDTIDLVWDPILDPVRWVFEKHIQATEHAVYIAECVLGLRKPPKGREGFSYAFNYDDVQGEWKNPDLKWVPNDEFNFDLKKKITSAIRRVAPNGQSNEIAFSLNVRALRQIIQTRTSEGAEWEIRNVFGQIYHLIAARYPLMFYKARTKVVDGLIKVYGMKCQPYEMAAGDPSALQYFTKEELSEEIFNRTHTPEVEGTK